MASIDGIATEVEKQPWKEVLVFTEEGKTLFTNIDVNPNEVAVFLKAFDSYENTFGAGIVFNGNHHETHRFYDNLIYGRRGDATEGNGVALAKAKNNEGKIIFAAITYVYPTVSAKAVARLRDFAEGYLSKLAL
uniref:Profilin n=1 Tax=Palpitomonas bilix TaxID=652834 RepID=A0A7S3G9A2_9EUKA|mmetsp:Transcript_36918/g.95608  ORF Transcript_36918/g.95608 Transcript_36918/m.95608 type:complete len:134 (+) Transcript_36918:430-831(+)